METTENLVCGLDEAGRGCLAGPVVAAAVIPPVKWSVELDDSKKLSVARRQELSFAIKAQAKAWALGFSWPREIERLNILQASLLAMARAVYALPACPSFLLVDGNQQVPCPVPQKTIVGGDRLVPAISAASILAKTFRDQLIICLALHYPGYGLERHKGYGTKEHLQKLREIGPSSLHRFTFRGVAQMSQGE